MEFSDADDVELLFRKNEVEAAVCAELGSQCVGLHIEEIRLQIQLAYHFCLRCGFDEYSDYYLKCADAQPTLSECRVIPRHYSSLSVSPASLRIFREHQTRARILQAVYRAVAAVLDN